MLPSVLVYPCEHCGNPVLHFKTGEKSTFEYRAYCWLDCIPYAPPRCGRMEALAARRDIWTN